MVSRSIGDQLAHTVGCSPEPSITAVHLDHNVRFVVLASDGIWDSMKNEDVVNMVDEKIDHLDEACEEIVQMAIAEWEAK